MRPTAGEHQTGGTERRCVVCTAADAARADEPIAYLINRAAASRPDSDIAIVLADIELPDTWLDRLRAPAC